MARTYFSTSEKRFIDLRINLDSVTNALAVRSLITLTEFTGIRDMIDGYLSQLPLAQSGESAENAELGIKVIEYIPTSQVTGIKILTAKDVENNFDAAIEKFSTAIRKSDLAEMADLQIAMYRNAANPLILFSALKQFGAVDNENDESYKMYLVHTPDNSIMIRVSKNDTCTSVLELAVKDLSAQTAE